MTKEEYERLLSSDYWKGFSYSIIKERNFTCEDCGRCFYNQRNKLQVHHLVYRDINPWSYKPEEMLVLCEECHKRRHGISTAPEANTTYNHDANGDYTKDYSYPNENKNEGSFQPGTFGSSGWTGGRRYYYTNNPLLANKKTRTFLLLLFILPFSVFLLVFIFIVYMIVKTEDSSMSHDFRDTPSYTHRELENGGYSEKEVQEIVNGNWDKETSDVEVESAKNSDIQKKTSVKKQTKRVDQVERKPEMELTTSERLERQSHNMMVRQAKRMGVSTEGSTSEIMDRISHENMVRQAKRMGVSTEGTTTEIMDRISHENMVRQAKRMGVSTEGSTSEIMDRISHENMVRQAKRLGVSTEGTTSEIMDRITRKQLENLDW